MSRDGIAVSELRFLLKLLSFSGYRAPLSRLQLAPHTKASVRQAICQNLCDCGWIACSTEVTHLKIAPPGSALLKLNHQQLPIDRQELQVLQACANQPITPAKTRLPSPQRALVIQGLADRGLIQLATKVKDVWITDEGKRFLRDIYNPKGNATISLDLLKNYLNLLRQTGSIQNLTNPPHQDNHISVKPADDAQLLQLIQMLDREQGTQNYLPLFYLRQALQPPLSREEVDQSLYRLQRQDLIELSSLQEAIAYTSNQVNAGIPQDIGGPLFFISVVNQGVGSRE